MDDNETEELIRANKILRDKVGQIADLQCFSFITNYSQALQTIFTIVNLFHLKPEFKL